MKRISDRQIKELMDKDEENKLKFEKLYIKLTERLITHPIQEGFFTDKIKDIQKFTKELVNHMLSCKALQKKVLS